MHVILDEYTRADPEIFVGVGGGGIKSNNLQKFLTLFLVLNLFNRGGLCL